MSKNDGYLFSICWKCIRCLYHDTCIWADYRIIPKGNTYIMSGKDAPPSQKNKEIIAYKNTDLNLKYNSRIQVTMVSCSNFVLDNSFREKERKCLAKKKIISD